MKLFLEIIAGREWKCWSNIKSNKSKDIFKGSLIWSPFLTYSFVGTNVVACCRHGWSLALVYTENVAAITVFRHTNCGCGNRDFVL